MQPIEGTPNSNFTPVLSKGLCETAEKTFTEITANLNAETLQQGVAAYSNVLKKSKALGHLQDAQGIDYSTAIVFYDDEDHVEPIFAVLDFINTEYSGNAGGAIYMYMGSEGAIADAREWRDLAYYLLFGNDNLSEEFISPDIECTGANSIMRFMQDGQLIMPRNVMKRVVITPEGVFRQNNRNKLG